MRLGQPLEAVLSDQERILDAWQSGGVRGLVLGRLVFQSDGPTARPVWAFAPNHTIYRRWDVPPPPEPAERFPERREQLDRLIERAKGRGWSIYLFEPAAGAGPPAADGRSAARHLLTDERHRRAYLARLEDTLTQFPQADGVVLDGPEWGYEIEPGHRANLFDDVGPEVQAAAQAMGIDYNRLVAASDRLLQRLHKISREVATLDAPGGVFNALHLLSNDPGIVSWFAFRARTMTAFYRQVHQVAEALTRARNRQVKLALSPRMPSFSALCGYDLPAMAPMFDLILPKLYIWDRGIDGLYGTVRRYVRTLMEWNPGLWEPEAFASVRALLGIALPATEGSDLPSITSLRELERGFPDPFFSAWLVEEVKRCIAASDGYPWKVLPWVDSGRRPHGGDPVTAHDLRRLLVATKEGGARQVLYHNHAHLTAAEWSVLSDFCGSAWREGEGLYGRYLPPDE
ncbi:MAG TPA: hypothetical protein VGW38_05580 [Chloroflexota bacterium]|nr:hypothetical protein [Chloroflexota bacterium]